MATKSVIDAINEMRQEQYQKEVDHYNNLNDAEKRTYRSGKDEELFFKSLEKQYGLITKDYVLREKDKKVILKDGQKYEF